MKADRTLLIIILGLLLFNLFNKQCSSLEPNNEPTISIVRDTVWQTKTDTFKVQTIKYKTVYAKKADISKIIESVPKKTDATQYVKAKMYRDTLRNADIDIYTYSLMEGNLLDSKLSYKLKVPREISITEIVEHPKAYRSGLYAFSELGGNTSTFNNLSLGLQYNRKGKWFVSYRANFSQSPKLTHNVGVGVRLLK